MCGDPHLFYFMVCVGQSKTQGALEGWQDQLSHPWVKVAQLASDAVTVGDLYVLVGARVHHHVPGIAVKPIRPVVVTLGRQQTASA